LTQLGKNSLPFLQIILQRKSSEKNQYPASNYFYLAVGA
jgi:hypothetical protein